LGGGGGGGGWGGGGGGGGGGGLFDVWCAHSPVSVIDQSVGE
jgi:hypothetical protein